MSTMLPQPAADVNYKSPAAPPITCLPPLPKGGRGDGVTDCHTSDICHWFAMTHCKECGGAGRCEHRPVSPYPMPRTIPQSSSHLSSFRFSLFKAYRFPYSAAFWGLGAAYFFDSLRVPENFYYNAKTLQDFLHSKKIRFPNGFSGFPLAVQINKVYCFISGFLTYFFFYCQQINGKWCYSLSIGF